ncbi:MAG TPA: PilT/PilU family type 4a pilus ATPase [Candidatus Binatia bacterium]|nr:PilT/PilU family type 4a pilus ATPase [Candidatus Binatia bacterium]
MDIQDYFKVMVEKDSSDLYLTVARPPMYRVDGKVQEGAGEPFKPPDLEALAQSFMSQEQWDEFKEKREMNLALALPNVSRFRVNVYRQRGSIGMVIRKIKVDIPSLDSLGLPPVLKTIAMLKRGLILVVGGTGAGKSTTLASMIDVRNSIDEGHIITIEDPIEFVHRHKKSIVSQREVGLDTNSFEDALVNAMRQAPDVILIGEIRNSETMEAAITFADTGHLCFGTLHSTNANQSFERILNFFPPVRHSQILLQLSLNLRAIVSQRLVPGVSGGRLAALEVLLDTPRIKDLIKKGEIDMLKEAMEQGIQEGCQSFDQALFLLYQAGKISLEEALANADSANNLRLKVKVAGLKTEEAVEREQREEPRSDAPKREIPLRLRLT